MQYSNCLELIAAGDVANALGNIAESETGRLVLMRETGRLVLMLEHL